MYVKSWNFKVLTSLNINFMLFLIHDLHDQSDVKYSHKIFKNKKSNWKNFCISIYYEDKFKILFQIFPFSCISHINFISEKYKR